MHANLNQVNLNMFNQQDLRRKGGANNCLKSNFGSGSQNSLLTNFEKIKSDHSKQKSRNKQIIQINDQIDPKGSATLNFKGGKNNQNFSNIQQKQYLQIKQPRKPMIEQAAGIQINLNIQNMVPQKRVLMNEVLSERSLSHKKRQDQKQIHRPKKIIHNVTEIDSFECTEQLQPIKIEKKTQKKIVNDKLTFANRARFQNIKPKMQIKQEVIDDQQVLRQFTLLQTTINIISQSQALQFLDTHQKDYEINSTYIEKKQKHFSWMMRATLIDWMMHITYEFKLKRETFHIAVTLVDNYLERTQGLPKSSFQLIGAAAMFIAAKLQEKQPLSSKEFARSTSGRYTAEQIKATEAKICKTLKFYLNPPTLNMWANKMMRQWDMFLDNTDVLKDPFFMGKKIQYFKKADENSYKNFRQVMQVIDFSLLDIQTVQYKQKILVCSLIYLILGKQYGQFKVKEIVNEFPRSSLYLLQESEFNSIFNRFLIQSFNINLIELLPSVQYMATYFVLPLSFDSPRLRPQDEEMEEMHLQAFCSYQTFNFNMMASIQVRFRGIYEFS